MLFSYELSQNSEAFQGVEATAGDMAQKPGDNLNFQKAPTIDRKVGKNSESDIWRLIFWTVSAANNNLSSVIFKHFPLFSLIRFLMLVLSKDAPFRKKITNNNSF